MTPFSNNYKPTAAKAKKTNRKRRPRRELPEDLTELYIADSRPTDLDVIAGRGGGSNHHEGNKRYWRRILVERPGYKQLGKNDNTEKNEIASAIFQDIISTGGRFLQLDSKTKKWFNIPEKISLDKIKQALRDKYVPHFAKGGDFAKEEPQSPTTAPPAPLPTPVFTVEEENKFFDFLNKKSSAPTTKNGFFSTPSLDLCSILGQSSLGKLDTPKISVQNTLCPDNFAPFERSLDKLDMLKKSGSMLSKNNMDETWSKFPTPNDNTMNKSPFESTSLPPPGYSLDHLMRGDLIKTGDNFMVEAKDVTLPKSTGMSEACENLFQKYLAQQYESAVPSSSGTRTVVSV
ncbi:unnamed protein product [Cylindrotheca closterium]|uniref:DUF6824 domain-containing protein n=1 Tax=Cylindrotheca closterium TaxID=2856 RepID=A0AAD2G971_9STRA|nr:unnamed protein product [Cylindrotheca closterium]